MSGSDGKWGGRGRPGGGRMEGEGWSGEEGGGMSGEEGGGMEGGDIGVE